MNDPLAILNKSPKFKELTEHLLFGDIWQRPQLSAKERSIVTLSILAALGRTEQLAHHLALAIENGLSDEELTEIFTHLAFYAGWPAAVSALSRLHPEE
jgi:4-carboxymuconolactone decarboxylase